MWGLGVAAGPEGKETTLMDFACTHTDKQWTYIECTNYCEWWLCECGSEIPRYVECQ
jgi:hypothetical protein